MKGLATFRKHFAAYADQFILIGGTAATLTMEEAGLEFRATKDVDIVLHIEALQPAFGRAFWDFVNDGSYAIRESSGTGKPVLYRFQKPVAPNYPFMLELFCRAPDGIHLAETSRLTPIPIDAAISSLSAILLEDAYYRFILDGRREREGLSWIGEDRLIPLKARAWLDLSDRRQSGETIDSRSIRKHAHDVIRLSQLLAPEARIRSPRRIVDDLGRFLERFTADGTYSPSSIGIDTPLTEIADRIAAAYES